MALFNSGTKITNYVVIVVIKRATNVFFKMFMIWKSEYVIKRGNTYLVSKVRVLFLKDYKKSFFHIFARLQ